jgi:hypothetical protein
MIVLALSGWKQSGKDLSALYLVEKHGFERVAFADLLKIMVAEEYKIPIESLYSQDLKEKALLQYPVESTDAFIKNIHDFMVKEFRAETGAVPTKLVQANGETFGLCPSLDEETHQLVKVYWTPRALAIFKGSGNRSVDANFWTKNIFNLMTNVNGKYVIPDLRFQTEIQELKKGLGDQVHFVRIDRFDNVNSSDPSERDLDKYIFDYRINNLISEKVTKDQLYERLGRIMEDVDFHEEYRVKYGTLCR